MGDVDELLHDAFNVSLLNTEASCLPCQLNLEQHPDWIEPRWSMCRQRLRDSLAVDGMHEIEEGRRATRLIGLEVSDHVPAGRVPHRVLFVGGLLDPILPKVLDPGADRLVDPGRAARPWSRR